MSRSEEFHVAHNGPQYSGTQGVAPNNNWRTHSIGENPELRGKNAPGERWDRYTALVPVHQLAKYMEYDRTRDHANPNSQATIDSIADDLRKGGVNALREHVSLDYDHTRKWGVLTEGNHRVQAAIKAGIGYIPVSIYGNQGNLERHITRGVGAPLHLDNRMVERGGYYPSRTHPGNFQEFEGTR